MKDKVVYECELKDFECQYDGACLFSNEISKYGFGTCYGIGSMDIFDSENRNFHCPYLMEPKANVYDCPFNGLPLNTKVKIVVEF